MSVDAPQRTLWLLKSEPAEFGIDDFLAARHQTTVWSGVRNYQVRNFIRDEMQPQDLGFFYHSSCAEPGVVGVVEIASEAYPDPTQFDPCSPYYDANSMRDAPRWFAMDVKLVRKALRPLGLKEMKAMPKLSGMRVLERGNRLSITPVSRQHWNRVIAMIDAH